MKISIPLILLLCLYIPIAYAQISLVKNFPNNGGASVFEPLNNSIIFDATDGLWRSDGTTAGTTLLTANARFDKSSFRRCRVGNLIYFWNNTGGNPPELWKTDGTQAGTVLVKAFADGRTGATMVNLNGILVFSYTTTGAGTELWRSDGTDAGTNIIVDLVPGTGSGVYADFPNSSTLNGYFYFQGPTQWDGTCNGPCNSNGSNYNYQPVLYRTDGTVAGTTAVSNGGYRPQGMSVLDDKLIYRADVPYTANYPNCSGQTITDFTTVLMKVEGGTANVLAYPPNITKCGQSAPLGFTFTNTVKFVKSSGFLYFPGTTTVNGQPGSISNLWRTDGTTTGTIQLTNFAENSGEGPTGYVFAPSTISDFGFTDIAYFSVFTNAAGSELWRSDGTANGTYQVKDINPGTGGSGPTTSGGRPYDAGPIDFRKVNNTIYFFASDGTNGLELWQTDGTGSGTQMVQDLNPGPGSQPLISYNDNVNGNAAGGIYYFSGDNTVSTSTGSGLYAVLPPGMYTVQTGSWNDPATWSGNRLPVSTDFLTLNHAVTLPNGYVGQALGLLYNTSGRLLFSAGGQVKLGSN